MIILSGQAELLQVIGAVDPIAGLAHLLHRWHKETDQDGDNGDDDQQFDKGKAVSLDRS
jgi:hypothetical protein